jgi:Domain of unknown function (DUF4037)
MWVSGLSMARRFYQQVVGPLLKGKPHAAALLGEGSEVLGFDDAISTDHDFGPRVQLFLPDQSDIAAAQALLRGLPEQFDGFPVRHVDADRDGHRVEVTTVSAFFTARLGVDPANGMSLADWLLSPTHVLAGLTSGEVFHDPDGDVAVRRTALRWYPHDIWRYALAAGWLRVGQEEAFVGRAGGRGDDLGSRIVAARLVRELARLSFLVERRWAPYSKWLGRAFADLKLAARLGPHLTASLAASGWRDREAALCEAASILVAATNDLGLAPPVDTAPRAFYDRDIRVIGAERLTVALADAITDVEITTLLDRLGSRHRTTVGMLPGTIDHAIDSTDVLCHPYRCRSAAKTIGLTDLN